jgi:hypothetical protein
VTPAVDTGFTVQVNASFDSLPNYTRIYFQDGKRVMQGSLDKWSTYCRLHVFNPEQEADYTSSVAAGSFRVAKVRNRLESSDSSYSGSGVQGFIGMGSSSHIAAAGLYRVRHDGPPSFYLYRVIINLTSTEQPDVQSLTCSRKWATHGNYFPSLDEIRGALGNQIEISVQSGSAITTPGLDSV